MTLNGVMAVILGHGPDMVHVHPPQLYQTRFFKALGSLNIKSSGNSKNIGTHYPLLKLLGV